MHNINLRVHRNEIIKKIQYKNHGVPRDQIMYICIDTIHVPKGYYS